MSDRYIRNLYTRFAAQVEAAPDAVALRYPDGLLVTRQQLAAMAEQQFERLIETEVEHGSVVALFHDKQPAAYALMLACLRLGAPCVNLDERNPPERIAAILATCRPAAIYAAPSLPHTVLAACCGHGYEVHSLTPRVADVGQASKPDAVIGSDIAYVMFTSGSTGIPKGVAISHAQVLNLIDWAADEFGIDATDTLSNVNPMYFDNSVFDFYASLFNGAVLAPMTAEITQNPRALVDAVEKTACTLWFSVPSMLIYLATTRVLDATRWTCVRQIVFGGEGYPMPELRKLFSLFGKRMRLVNVYGPTECTCICSAHHVTETELADELPLPPIGALAANFRGLLLDESRLVASGEIGELCLVGPNVGLGYYNDPGRTDDAFVANPLCGSYLERMYRTGDLMRQDVATGVLHFVGRKDHQFKHMGYRIEPGEIEAALNRLEGIERAVVVYKRRRSAHGEIIAFVAAGSNTSWKEEALRESLLKYLPAYMIPHRIEIRASLPSNANGKVDRKKLFEEA